MRGIIPNNNFVQIYITNQIFGTCGQQINRSTAKWHKEKTIVLKIKLYPCPFNNNKRKRYEKKLRFDYDDNIAI